MTGTTQAMRGTRVGLLQPSSERLDLVAAWYEAEYPSLLRFAYLVCGNEAQAQDLVQDAFVRLYRAAGRINPETVGAYARRTIVNLSRSAFRRRATEQRSVTDIGAAIADPHTDPHDAGARDEMWRAILTLSQRQRAVIALRFYEDMPEREVADALGMSIGSVKQHTDRAMKALRARLGDRSEP